jgi:hypothetical protein
MHSEPAPLAAGIWKILVFSWGEPSFYSVVLNDHNIKDIMK